MDPNEQDASCQMAGTRRRLDSDDVQQIRDRAPARLDDRTTTLCM